MTNQPVDTIAPWTIKACSTKTRLAVNKAAQQEGITVGQWLDKRVAEWLADGSPVHVAAPVATPENLGALAALAGAALSMAQAAGVAPPPSLAKHMLALTSSHTRSARGLKPRRVLAAPSA